MKSEMERGFDVIPTLVFVQLKLAPQLRVDRSANASVNADGMAKFSIYNLSQVLASDLTAKVLTVFSNRHSIFENDGSSHEGVLL